MKSGFRSSKRFHLSFICNEYNTPGVYLHPVLSITMYIKRIYFNAVILSVITAIMLLYGCNRSSQNSDSEATANADSSKADSSENIKPETMKYIETFQADVCDEILLEYYNKLSDEGDNIAPQKQATITDTDTIKKIITLLHAFPDQGDMMVKMGNVPVLKVTLIYQDMAVFFKYYENSVQTPATSFYATPPKEEKLLFELLMTIVNL